MAFTPRNWRTLKQHPLGADYEPWDKETMKGVVADLKEHGNVTGRCIWLYEGKVLDGWNFLQAHIELDLPPKFRTLHSKTDPAAFVSICNDRRRHETQESAHKRAEARRQRILAARSGGATLREIAAKEKVSTATVRRDISELEEKKNTEKVLADPSGKQHKVAGKPTFEIFCERCDRVGPVKNCNKCKELRSQDMKVHKLKKRGWVSGFDWKKLEPAKQTFAQLPDRLRAIYPSEKNAPELRGLDRLLDEVFNTLKKFRTRIERE